MLFFLINNLAVFEYLFFKIKKDNENIIAQ